MASMETGLMVMDGMVNQPALQQPIMPKFQQTLQMQQIQLIQQEISLTNVLQINVQKAADEQDKLNQNVNKSTSSMSALATKASETFKSFFNAETLKNGISAVIGEASKMQDKMISVQGMLGNKEAGTAYFNHLQKQANESGFSFDELKNNAQSFMGVTKNTESLDKLANLSERLSLGNSGEGISGAGGAINSMLSGDGSDLKDKFGFSSEDMGVLQASKDLDDFTSKFDVLLNKKGLDSSMLDEFNNSASSQFENLKENFDSSLGTIGLGLLNAINPAMQMLNEMFSDGAFQGIISGICMGIGLIATLICWVGDVVTSNWDIIQPMLISLGIALLAILIPLVFQFAFAWVIANLPILILIGTIMLLIYFLNLFGINFQQIIGFIGGLFMGFVGFIYNSIALVWNIVAALAEFFANVFNHPLYSVQRLFYNIWNSIVEFIGGALDWIVEKAKSIPFLKDLIGDFSIGSFKMDIPEPPEDYVSVQRMETKDLNGQFNLGYSSGSNFVNGISDKFKNNDAILNSYNEDNMGNNFNNSLLNQGGNNSSGIPSDMGGGSDALTSAIDNTNLGNNVSEGSESLKGINDSVEVSNENLDLMNDLAELESIQNFITLTPTVQVTTGDIRKEADIDTIISRIESYMENEMTNSAEGLYA
ncbi:tail length tape measure protein [Clostridium sp. CMCC3677]|uniref:tail length tape measure protein n=1 Tax=Clostridium sp. CMCC3677 TaxID=2949963 RepID=UPI0013F0744C|nr:tail length tape measure protein [Clostridium sp. CMCC3677]NFG60538.1 tail length tape measure protein [Clostridium botulinum]NFQ09819.1 tail length tape measure protein [Clostridium botulinum]